MPENKVSSEPIFFKHFEENEQVDSLIAERNPAYFDLFDNQKEELRKTEYFGLSEEVQNDKLQKIQPNWVYLPWVNELYKILSINEFRAVRSSRNRYKITREEQNTLLSKKVGVVGLSVGRTVSLTMALEGLCGVLRVADFDEIELSNLNRLKAPLRDYHVRKTTSTKREILQIDPYLKVECYDEGIHTNNLDEFFTKNGQLDLVVDECDSLEVKILLRKKAKELGIPLLMDTSDRGMLDIERYDLDAELKYFNGLVGDFDPPYNFELTPEDRGMLLSDIVSIPSLSRRMQSSFSEIGKTISTWPQLASSVTMGGGVTANVCRRILLGENIESGRYYIDLEELIPDANRR